jgi:hypothetical protein
MRLGINLLIAALSAALFCGTGRAAEFHPRDAAHALDGTDNVAEVSMLQEAYRTLAKADHDYAGHRKKAMKALEKACDLLGQGASTGGGRQERQAVSDDELRAAQRIIQQVRDTAAQRGQHVVAGHLDIAISEISQALAVK